MVSNASKCSAQSLVQLNQSNIERQEKVLQALTEQSRNASTLALIHRLAARRWSSIDDWISLPNTILATVSGTSALANFDKTSSITNTSAVIVAILTSAYVLLQPKQKSATHFEFANKYHLLRRKIDGLILSESINLSRIEYHQAPDKVTEPKINDLVQRLLQSYNKILNEMSELDVKAPLPPRWASKVAVEIVNNTKSSLWKNIFNSIEKYFIRQRIQSPIS